MTKEVDGTEQPEKIPLYHSPFWIRIKHLPLNCRSNSNVKELVSNMGEVVEIEEDPLGLDCTRRVKVMLNVTKPLHRVQRVRDKCGNIVLVEFAYKRLPFFCYACGVIGHSDRDCVMVSEKSKKKRLGGGDG
ncbi:uncharacterized protein LOC110725422 [Chenopodium quinoa]|uniref:uncharacterized protein LOC110725422 n=1 Tax=Chenopodium quinoa TaxID=63459 RepID=UPI000B7810B5|nr:uncharacterized protein LOC110725422 [Chenopodium quinoa]